MKKAITLKDEEGNAIYPCPYYPIGAIYMSVTNHNPETIFGGKWEQIQDVFLLGCGSIYKNGTKGGEASHQLTINEMPKHNHDFTDTGRNLMWDSGLNSYGGLTSGTTVQYTWNCNTKSVGGNQAHNNMPPYLAVYIWKRIA